MKIHIDISEQELWHRREWERRLLALASHGSGRFSLVDNATSADCTVRTQVLSLNSQSLFDQLRPLSRSDIAQVVWDSGDYPTGRASGLYCSLPFALHDEKRHRSFCYPLIYNEMIEHFPQSDAVIDYSFVGGITSGLRARVLNILKPVETLTNGMLRIQLGPWNSMFDRSGVREKREFAEAVRKSRFILCPRGNGVGSVRLFETLKAGRVPVIISDAFVLPTGIDWSACTVRVRERDIASIPNILGTHLGRWSTLATNARAVWVSHFSDESLLDEMGQQLTDILIKSPKYSAVHRSAYYPCLFSSAIRWHVKKSIRAGQRLIKGSLGE